MNPSDLRALAKAIEELQNAEQYISDTKNLEPKPTNVGVRIEWSWGSKMPGYEELRNEVRVILEDMWPDLVRKALERVRQRKIAAEQKVYPE